MDSGTVRSKQLLGAYYTPEHLARVITGWAIRSPTDTLLDPSFGGCAFLYAGLKALQGFNLENPGQQVYGVDIDPEAKGYVAPLIESGADPSQFIIDNFLTVFPIDYGDQLFTCVLGNPPYVNYHKIAPSEQKIAQARLKEAGYHISGRASYWAFILLHSLRFICTGGRMAMVLPSAFLRADYAAEVRRIVSACFSNITIVLLQERIFEDTEEQAVVLFAEGFGESKSNSNISVLEVRTVDALACMLAQEKFSDKAQIRAVDENIYHGLLPKDTLDLMHELENEPAVTRLGEWASIRIGVVTGNNRFFIIPRSKKQILSVTDDLVVPIVTRPHQLAGLSLNQPDVEELVDNDKRCFLLSVNDDSSLPAPLEAYFTEAPTLVRTATKCRERKPWYSVRHRFAPPAFMPYMASTWPRIVVNLSNATCTNNIHRLEFHISRPPEDWFRLALGSLSSLSQLSSELVGRSYGAGVLKLEPREALQLLIPANQQIDPTLMEYADAYIRQGNFEAATSLADDILLKKGLGLSKAEIRLLRSSRDYLHQRRRR